MSDALHDPNLRRDTPLALKLKAWIRQHGPMPVADYMDACLNDPECGYYRTQTAIGRHGDFITAPEISQVFGELIGLWCAVVWRQMGSPPRLDLVEIGAGRGTLLADALRALRVVPKFRAAIALHILDRNPALVEAQRAALSGSGVTAIWHETFDTLPGDAHSIWVANEFLDTLPVEQLEKRDGAWTSRMIGMDSAGRLVFTTAPLDSAASAVAHSFDADAWPDGAIVEIQSANVIANVLQRKRNDPIAALFVDYGHAHPASAETLQAVRNHRYEHILMSPGEADLSCQVDFADFARQVAGNASSAPLAIDGPVTQAEFLGKLGIMERASRLMAANPGKANAIEMGVARLMAPQGMGTRFKAIGVRQAGLPTLPGF